jgi:hypothetical protein
MFMFNLNANVIASMAKEEGAIGIEKSIHYQDYFKNLACG